MNNMNNKMVILRLFQEHGPCTVAEVIPYARKEGVTIPDDSFSPYISNWYNTATEGWQYLHRMKVPKSLAYLYEFDGAVERKPRTRTKRIKKDGSKVPTKALARIDSKATEKSRKPAADSAAPELFAKVLHAEPDFVVMLTQDRRLIVGAIYEPARP